MQIKQRAQVQHHVRKPRQLPASPSILNYALVALVGRSDGARTKQIAMPENAEKGRALFSEANQPFLRNITWQHANVMKHKLGESTLPSCSTESRTWDYEAGESLGADVEPKSSSITTCNDDNTVSSAYGTAQANESANHKQSIANTHLHCPNQ